MITEMKTADYGDKNISAILYVISVITVTQKVT